MIEMTSAAAVGSASAHSAPKEVSVAPVTTENAPPGLLTIRDWQRETALVHLDWLRERLDR
jgi:hypothetical protein